MIFNDEVLFLHIPKTAGKSISLSLTRTLRRPLWCHVPPGTERSLREGADLTGVEIVRSNGHEGVTKAFATLRAQGIDPTALRQVLVVIRNPYDLMVSNYHFMREQYDANAGRPNFEAARNLDFEAYTREVAFFDISRFFLEDQANEPPQLRILRYETLQADLDAALGDLGHGPVELPRLNASSRPDARSLLTPAAEEAIYAKFQYLFDRGFYERAQHERAQNPSGEARARSQIS